MGLFLNTLCWGVNRKNWVNIECENSELIVGFSERDMRIKTAFETVFMLSDSDYVDHSD